jgi:hypothetical protein
VLSLFSILFRRARALSDAISRPASTFFLLAGTPPAVYHPKSHLNRPANSISSQYLDQGLATKPQRARNYFYSALRHSGFNQFSLEALYQPTPATTPRFRIMSSSSKQTYSVRAKNHPNHLVRKLFEVAEAKKTNVTVSADVTTTKELLDLADRTSQGRRNPHLTKQMG